MTEAVAAGCGFDPCAPGERACFAPAAWLAAALVALPFLLHLLIDTDRAVPLAFLPAVWAGWKISQPARRLDTWLLVWALAAMLLSTIFAAHAARALVMVAAVGWTIAGALVARNLAQCVPAVRLVLAGIAAGAVIGVVMVRLGLGADRMYFPTYWSARLLGAHQFAGALAMLGILVVTPPARRSVKILAAIAAIIIWTGLAWSGSRAAVLGLGVALLLWFWRGTALERRRLLLWVPPLAVLSLVLSYPLGTPYPQLGWWDAWERTVQASDIESISSRRSHLWTGVWQEITRSPWIGHGADSYLYIHPNLHGNQPHSALLQWLLEYGLLGTIPLVILVGRGMAGLISAGPASLDAPQPYRTWSSAAVAGAAVYAIFDGVFYHMIVFMPVAAITGIAFGHLNAASPASLVARIRAIGRPALLAGVGLLLLHNCLYVLLIKARNVAPDSVPARIVRAFPSTTYALENWIWAWRQTQPELAMEWIKWAQDASIHQSRFHNIAAQIHIFEKDYKSAEAEFLRCLEKVHQLERPDVLEQIENVRRRADEQARQRANLTPNPSTETPPRPDAN